METEFGRLDMLSASFPTFVVCVMALTAIAIWIGAHFLKQRIENPWQARGFFIVRVMIGTAAIWACLQFAGRFIMLATHWSLLFNGLIGAAAVEIIIRLYDLERRVVSKSIGTLILCLRIALALLVLAMLVQPVFSYEFKRKVERYIVVLLDDSESMHFADKNLTISEKLNLAEAYNLDAVKKRCPLDVAAKEFAELQKNLMSEAAALQTTTGADVNSLQTLLMSRKKTLEKALEKAKKVVKKQIETVDKILKQKNLDKKTKLSMESMRKQLKHSVILTKSAFAQQIDKADEKKLTANYNAICKYMATANEEIGHVLQQLPLAAANVDKVFYRSLNKNSRNQIDKIAKKTRAAIAWDILTLKKDGRDCIIDQIKSRYHLKVVRFAKKSVELNPDNFENKKNEETVRPQGKEEKNEKSVPADAGEKAFRQLTDITSALEEVLKDIPPENLAGILLLTDGQHNGESSVESVARRLGIQESPICSVVIGGAKASKDASILNVHVPESIYLGDKVSIKSSLKLNGMRGQKVKVKLLRKGMQIKEEVVDVPDEHYRTIVRFTDTPQKKGIFHYTLELEHIKDEIFDKNNRWNFDVAVTDDRTNVLLVDNRPRWEFRYLRNLFYGRDKSVHLQYVLLNPDWIEDAKQRNPVYASAVRKFGDAEATDLPKNKDEWQKFDVIIIGDVPPDVLNDKKLEIIQHCVTERGALLVILAGPRFMPHAYNSKVMKNLLPIQFKTTKVPYFATPEPAYRLNLTPDGRNHIIMQQSTSSSENAQIWKSLPLLFWRHPIIETKKGATILAYANPIKAAGQKNFGFESEISINEAARRLEHQMKLRSRNALIVIHKYAQGRVMMLNFDRTWRLRYRVGDTYHHKFWGQVLRWGAAENLRSGTKLVRLGTDKLTYTPADPVNVLAKIVTSEYKPVTDDKVYIDVYFEGKRVRRKRMQYRQDSNGIYETALNPLTKPGRYTIKLDGKKSAKILALENVSKVETKFLVVTTKSPVELSELTVNRSIPDKIAGLSGGYVAGPENAKKMLDFFGPESKTIKERKETTLWDSWPLFLLMLCVVSTEWILRKKRGLI